MLPVAPWPHCWDPGAAGLGPPSASAPSALQPLSRGTGRSWLGGPDVPPAPSVTTVQAEAASGPGGMLFLRLCLPLRKQEALGIPSTGLTADSFQESVLSPGLGGPPRPRVSAGLATLLSSSPRKGPAQSTEHNPNRGRSQLSPVFHSLSRATGLADSLSLEPETLGAGPFVGSCSRCRSRLWPGGPLSPRRRLREALPCGAEGHPPLLPWVWPCRGGDRRWQWQADGFQP